jgi:choline kinase
MRSVILAAGTSSRLRPLTNELPKCLLEVGGVSILRRMLTNCLAAGVKEVMIVTGFEAKKIRDAVRTMDDRPRVRFAHNPYFEKTNNAYSLLLAKSFLIDNRGLFSHPFMLLDSDIAFSSALLPRLLSATTQDQIAVRVAGPHDEEEMRVQIGPEGTVATISKQIPLAETAGESVGIETFSPTTASRLFEILEHRIRGGTGRNEFYEAAFQQLIDEGTSFAPIDVGERSIVEVDTIEDLAMANSFALAWPR